ncbi:MAG: hypothetical protein KDD76_04465 [Rickettsiales bacterium]|nr:hypothetical protein [Rickettsiales bacterium]
MASASHKKTIPMYTHPTSESSSGKRPALSTVSPRDTANTLPTVDEISELYTLAASRKDLNFMCHLREHYNSLISDDACRAVFLHAVDIEHIPMLEELAEVINTKELFRNPAYVRNVLRFIQSTRNQRLLDAVLALPGIKGEANC